jgi:thiol-disulfide isomerase/thioredoxin
MRSLILCSALAALGASVYAASPVPRPALPMEMVDSSGVKHVLANYKGKVVVVQFLLTTCSHCQAFSGVLGKLQTEYGPRGFQALGAAVNEATPEMARNYFTQFAKVFPVGPYDEGLIYKFLGLSVMDQPGFPQIAVIDRKGQIREQSSGNYNDHQPLQDEPHLRGLIETLLKEGAATSGAAVKTATPAVTAATKKQ